MEDNTRKKLIALIVVLLIVVVGVGITFAFFSPSLNQQDNITVDVTASDNAKVTFTNGSNLVLNAIQPGISATSYFNVEVESPGGTITGVYDIYWVISNNTFEHDSAS